ncbi:hypothetical protein [Streptomyces sp. NPDC088350]|uniref:hypothetical protein n=1 Tax=Streptomyces sp. NPDC088350 TaxID=3365854 RepID=UPI0037F73DEF
MPSGTPFDTLLLWPATRLAGFARVSVAPGHDPDILTRTGSWDAAGHVRDRSPARLLTRKLPLRTSGSPLWEFLGPRGTRGHRPRLTVRPAPGGTPGEEPAVIRKQHVCLTFDWDPPAASSCPTTPPASDSAQVVR